MESSGLLYLAEACLQLLHDDARRSFLARAGAQQVAERFTANSAVGLIGRALLLLYETRGNTQIKRASKDYR